MPWKLCQCKLSQTMEKNMKNVKGKCMQMCPGEEILLREKEKLLHLLEMVPGTEKTRNPKASQAHMVKSFSRSAAGKKMNIPDNLRPPKILLKTISYLLFEVINTKLLPWHAVYDFVTDRIMAVRQDMVVQDISKAENITILQPIIRFHAYAAYNLCEESRSNFDSVLNNTHLQECLKKLLYLYDLCFEAKSYEYLSKVQPEFEALYILFNLGHDEALRRSLTIPKNDHIIKIAFDISVSYKHGNFIRACRLVKNLPALLAAVASLHLPSIRRKMFQVMATAYNSKNLRFPTNLLTDMLLYESADLLLKDLKYYGIIGDKVSISFTKQSFLPLKDVMKPKHEKFVEDKLIQDDLQNILFNIPI